MTRYLFCIVRCVPNPKTGEFVNVGAIAGNPETADWAVRRVSSDSRALKLGTADSVAAVHTFLTRIGEEFQQLEVTTSEIPDSFHLGEDWLRLLHHDQRNVVQLTAPAPIVATDAESALDVLFQNFIIDPVTRPRGYVTKSGVLANLREVYRDVEIDLGLLRSNAEIVVGDRLRAPIDLAVANGRVYQITQAWSFQRSSLSDVTTQVKAWGYAISRLQGGDAARLFSTTSATLAEVPRNVDIQVAVAEPRSDEQGRAFEEAEQVFGELGASVHAMGDLQSIGIRAVELVSQGDHPT